MQKRDEQVCGQTIPPLLPHIPHIQLGQRKHSQELNRLIGKATLTLEGVAHLDNVFNDYRREAGRDDSF